MTQTSKLFEISTEFYSKDAILNSGYKFTGKYYVKIEPLTEIRFSVNIKSRDDTHLPDDLELQFFNDLIDQQIRINVEKEYKTIREEIVKKAFSPVNSNP